MKTTIVFVFLLSCCLMAPNPGFARNAPVSDATAECLDCHGIYHPGIVADWRASRHAQISPDTGKTNGRISATEIPEVLKASAVGCAECHTLRPKAHADTFEHNGYDVHVVVSPPDCAVCHGHEAEEYAENIMSFAYGNLEKNDLYQELVQAVIGAPHLQDHMLSRRPPQVHARESACLYCHGTQLQVKATETRETDVGELTFPVISGWPNQGVGRINPDLSRGACTPCHTRHAFDIETARKPESCKECHLGPDVPAYKVYSVSKHGNLYDTRNAKWDFGAVPWTVGRDFTAPTCAVCHISEIADTDGQVVASRTHKMKDRLAWRIFGLIYAHPQPTSADTTIIRNKNGRPLPTDLDGGVAEAYLINPQTRALRTQTMQSVCKACHSTSWVRGHWARFEAIIDETNAETHTATELIRHIWQTGQAQGFDQGQNPFDEALEKKWVETWLFYANSTRFAAAMAGGGDYAVFADGRYTLSRNMQELAEALSRGSTLKP